MNKYSTKLLNVQSILWVSLLLALAGSLRHLAAMFAGIDGNNFYGYLSAIAVDAGLFSLSYSLRQRKAQQRKTNILWLGIVLFSGISIYGNLAYGILATDEVLPQWISLSRPYILAASLPILVLYLAELVSDNQHHTTTEPKTLAAINEQRRKRKEAKIEKLIREMQNDPEATITKLAESLNVSRGTVRNYKAEINGNGTTNHVLPPEEK